MATLPVTAVLALARLAKPFARARAERLLSGSLFVFVEDPSAFEALLTELRSARDAVARTERAMALQLRYDRTRKGPGLRGPFYEEGEIVRHLERGDERLVRRHLALLRAG